MNGEYSAILQEWYIDCHRKQSMCTFYRLELNLPETRAITIVGQH